MRMYSNNKRHLLFIKKISAHTDITITTCRARSPARRSKCTFSLESKCYATLRTLSSTTKLSCAEITWKSVFVNSMKIVPTRMDTVN